MPITLLAFSPEGLTNLLDKLPFQVVGMVVVFLCLGGLAVVLSITGSIGAKLAEKAKAPKAPKAQAPAAKTPAPAPAAAGSGSKGALTPETLAIISAAIDSAMTELTPEMVAVISAAVDAGLEGMEHRIVNIEHVSGAYAASGRAEIFASRRIHPTR